MEAITISSAGMFSSVAPWYGIYFMANELFEVKNGFTLYGNANEAAFVSIISLCSRQICKLF